MEMIEIVLIVVAVGSIVAVFAAYTVGRSTGYAEGRTVQTPLVAALENQVTSYEELNDALKRQVAAQKTQTAAQERLIKAMEERESL